LPGHQGSRLDRIHGAAAAYGDYAVMASHAGGGDMGFTRVGGQPAKGPNRQPGGAQLGQGAGD